MSVAACSFSAAHVTIGETGVHWGEATQHFVRESGFTSGTQRVYSATLRHVENYFQRCTHLCCLDVVDLRDALFAAYGDSAAATWNRTLSTLRRFLLWIGRNYPDVRLEPGLVEQLPTRRPAVTTVRPSDVDLINFCFDDALPLRDRVLWALLYDSGVGVDRLLAARVEDVDLRRHAIEVHGVRLRWGSGLDELVRRLVGNRRCGYLFESSRSAPRTSQSLSYRRAADGCRFFTGYTLTAFSRAGRENLSSLISR